MTELTREQESTIARLAINHGSVKVTPDPDSANVRVDTPLKVLVLDEDGVDIGGAVLAATEAHIAIPLDVIRELCGVEVVRDAVEKAELVHGRGSTSLPYALGQRLGDDFLRVLRSMVLA